MASVYNTIDGFAMKSGAAIVLIHHASKGNQAEKSVTDVGSGAGAISRAADTHVVLREHKEPDVIVMDTALRSWPPSEPICLRWAFPLWEREESLNPAELKKPMGGRKVKAEQEKWTAKRFRDDFVTTEPTAKLAIIDDAVTDGGLTQKLAENLLKRAAAKELVYLWKIGSDKRQLHYATVPQPAETLAA